VCSEFDGFEDALASGDVSGDHLDVLARLTRNLSDADRTDLHTVAGDLLASATHGYVSEFERTTRDILDRIASANAPGDEAAEPDRQRAESRVKRWTDRSSGMKMTLMSLDPVRDAAFHTAVDAHSARLRQDPANASTPFSQLQVDAVIAAVSAGEAAHRVPSVTVHVDHRSLCHGRHADTLCETSDGTRLPVVTAQRLCCEAVIGAVVIDRDGTVRELCAEQRTATRAQRRALAAMYRTCAHPHCDVAFDHCRVHHVVRFSDGGATSLPNLIPLCEQHHHLVHEGGWGLTMTADRVVTWTRPDGAVWKAGPAHDRTACGRPPTETPPTETPPTETPPAETPPTGRPNGPPAEHRRPSLC
jgi:hypothetical protein